MKKEVGKKGIYHNRNLFSVTMCERQRVKVNNNMVINDYLSREGDEKGERKFSDWRGNCHFLRRVLVRRVPPPLPLFLIFIRHRRLIHRCFLMNGPPNLGRSKQ